MLLACHKRPVPVDALRELADDIERDLFQQFEEEVPSQVIGDVVLERLKDLDTVAFVRFASVYQEFQTIDDFHEIIESVSKGRGSRRKQLVI